MAMRVSGDNGSGEDAPSVVRLDAQRRPCVFDYLDYREFLKDTYRVNKAANPRFSCRYIAAKVGFKSASYFTQVLHGRSEMTSAMALRFADFLKMERREREYLELLVLYARSRSVTERRCYLERLSAFRESKVSLVPPEHYEFYECWYHTAIRELLHIEPFDGDCAALARRLRPTIPVAKVRESIELLVRLGMARRDENGLVVRADALSTTSGEAIRSVQLGQFHAACLELARAAIDEIPHEERSISTLTMTLSQAAIGRVNREIAEFRKRILAIAEADVDEHEVYHLGIQFFPMTQGGRS